MQNHQVEQHPLPLFLPENAQMLMLGSFPPPKARWSMEFYYPNLQNDMWRIFGIIFCDDKNHFLKTEEKAFDKDKIISFLNEKGIALGDTARSVIRLKDNASDAFLQIVEPLDLSAVLHQLPLCKAIVVTGQKAAETLCSVTQASMPAVGCYSPFQFENRPMRLYRMPSSSRAYPLALSKKAEAYGSMFHDLEQI
jgi:G:T/U mismatch-specific DNA glycosylase